MVTDVTDLHQEFADERLPPGQRLTERFPVLSKSGTPSWDRDEWRFEVWGAVDDDLSCPSRGRCHHWKAAGHRFEHYVRQTFVGGGESEHLELRKSSLHLLSLQPACELHSGPDLQSSG